MSTKTIDMKVDEQLKVKRIKRIDKNKRSRDLGDEEDDGIVLGAIIVVFFLIIGVIIIIIIVIK